MITALTIVAILAVAAAIYIVTVDAAKPWASL
jgi:hypothetical protein